MGWSGFGLDGLDGWERIPLFPVLSLVPVQV